MRGRDDASKTHSLTAYTFILGLVVLCYSCLSIFRDTPVLAVLLLDFLVCLALALHFRTGWSWMLLLHPPILFLSGQFFARPFLELGDGPSYVAVVQQYLDTSTLTFTGEPLSAALGLLDLVKYLSLGAAPIIAVPEYFFGFVDDQVYYFWQGTFHVLLVSSVSVLASSWNVIAKRDLIAMTLFAILSPSFFDMGAAPTRHFVTFFGVFLLFLTHLAVTQRASIDRLVWFGVAMIAVVISKWMLLLPYLVFATLDLFLLTGRKRPIAVVFLGLVAGGVGVGLGSALIGAADYNLAGIAREGGATFTAATQTPVVGWIFKYIYALLSPFPWSKWSLHTDIIYGGNLLLFLMHVASAFIGTYIFLSLAIRWREIALANDELQRRIIYPLVMSLSIIGGSTGFHTYILIYFPMLAPLLFDRRFVINPVLPFLFIMCVELFVVLAG
jgi:hypothetical protein